MKRPPSSPTILVLTTLVPLLLLVGVATLDRGGPVPSTKTIVRMSVEMRGDASDIAEDLGDSRLEVGSFQQGAAWPRGSDGSWTIGVCWENPGYQYASEMQLVQQQIEQTWQRHSQIKFEGWGPCKPESLGIRIHVSDGQLLGQKQSTTLIDDRKGDVAVELDAELPSQAIAYGRFLDGIANGLILELGPPQTASSPRQRCMRVFANRGQSMAKSRELCIRYEASHMFGHALGLRHPRNEREPFNAPETEATGGCTSLSAAGAASDTGEAPAAVRSVISRPAKAGSFMSKCAPPENVGELSHSDIVLIMSVYGRDCNAAVNPNCLRQGARE